MRTFARHRYRPSYPKPLLIVAIALAAALTGEARGQVAAFAGDASPAVAKGKQIAVLAGGCFWGVDAVFRHVKGVKSVVSGYSGGNVKTAHYEEVGTGTTGHAESVKITYEPSQISYSELLRIFFSVATDPTQLNRQGPDVGTQYRSVIFYVNDEQNQIAQAYIAQLDRAKAFPGRIVTQIVPFEGFYPAEDYHQDFLARHPDNPYIVFNDLPKLRKLKEEFPGLYKR